MARSVAKATHDSGPAVQSNQPREDAASIGRDATSVVTGERALVKRIVARSAIGRYGRRSKTSSLNPQHIFFMSVEGLDSTRSRCPRLGDLKAAATCAEVKSPRSPSRQLLTMSACSICPKSVRRSRQGLRQLGQKRRVSKVLGFSGAQLNASSQTVRSILPDPQREHYP